WRITNAVPLFKKGSRDNPGVATFCRDSAVPLSAEEGLSGILANQSGTPAWCTLGGFSDEELKALDGEGRAVITKHRIRRCEQAEEILTVINVYCPRADPDREDRSHFKLRFYQLLQARAQALLQDGGNVIVLGDMNTAHTPIDHCQPGDPECFARHPDRVWMNGFLCSSSGLLQSDEVSPESDPEPGLGTRRASGHGLFVDAFRLFHPTEREAYTCWRTSSGARKTNYGTRIDYIFVNKSLAETELQDCILMPEVEGSDHCPVKAFLKASCVSAGKCPPLCTKYLPEFAGFQQKLPQFLVNVQNKQISSELRNYPQLEQNSQSLVDLQRKKAKLDRPRSGKGSLSEKGRSSRSKPGHTGTLLRFFKPASALGTHDDLGRPHLTPLSVPHHQQAQAEGGKEDTPAQTQQNKSGAAFWKSLLKGLPPPPNCSGHQEPCLLRTVRKPGPSQGRQFYICAHPEGSVSNPASRCNFFRWANTGSKRDGSIAKPTASLQEGGTQRLEDGRE
ncbi:DNA-(apurinic or apyrimidinic site) lyase 2, partial [Scyliorhinus canicula]|uniref:DNA-(apurinic or apyrimidinic site) lyase 2 n=1 Tax=Scyliorhinus canicula TaxID=7830 RepID=UPI0018F31E14